MFFTFLALTSAFAAAPIETQANHELDQIVSSEAKKGFSSAKCPRLTAKQWTELLILGKPVAHEFKFAPGCDLEGRITLDSRKPFPMDLKVRHYRGVGRVQAVVSSEFEPDLMNAVVAISLRAKNAKIDDAEGKRSLELTADYALVIALDGSVQDNKGGRAKISKYRDHAVALDRPFKIK